MRLSSWPDPDVRLAEPARFRRLWCERDLQAVREIEASPARACGVAIPALEVPGLTSGDISGWQEILALRDDAWTERHHASAVDLLDPQAEQTYAATCDETLAV